MMKLTKDMVSMLRFPGRMEIDAELEALLFRRFGKEQHSHEYSEQDLHEQVRKIVMLYNRERGLIRSL